MFGYVTVNPGELKVREYELYRSYYCGVCRELGERSGQISRLLLSYDMTFLALLESALYELPEKSEKRRCFVHPVRSHGEIRNEATAYAADMTVLLGYQKAMDDWQDEHSVRGLTLGMTQRADYRRLSEVYPRQKKVLESAIRKLHEAEQAGSTDVDYVAGLTGRFLGSMFDWKEDVWSRTLREMGFYLGKFIYLMDAWEDCEKDEKNGSYNVLLSWKKQDGEGFDAHVKAALVDMMTQCALRFERLPILQNCNILKNILYAGVWMKYAALQHKETGGKGCRLFR